ncbi:MAG: hypothetical protein AAF772_21685, partial [Acidobacteriota bacterium]
PTQPSDSQEGRRIWGDLVGFARLLVQINNREELREHDRRLIRELLDSFFNAIELPDHVPDDILAALQKLVGCDDELDQLLARPSLHPPERFHRPLSRILRNLERQQETPNAMPTMMPPF